MSVYPSVLMEKLGSHGTDIYEILCVSIFRKSVKKIQVSVEPDKNKEYFAWRPLYFLDHISLSS